MKSNGSCRILVVEDSSDDAELILASFAESRFRDRLLLVRDGESALGALEKTKPSQLPALILLDLGLPGLDGLEVLRRIRADSRYKYVAVIAFTSDTSERDRDFALQGGANLFVVKPTDGAAFIRFVRWVDGLLEFID